MYRHTGLWVDYFPYVGEEGVVIYNCGVATLGLAYIGVLACIRSRLPPLEMSPSMTTIGTRLFTWLKGEHVGTDDFGHRYYQEKRLPKDRRRKRWVIYRGEDEASAVPPDWHAWLHYMIDELPQETINPIHSWQKPHAPNLTGTSQVYRPPGHTLQGGKRPQATGDYDPWIPN